MARQYFSPAETRLIETVTGTARQRFFLQLWSLKEAALKSIGEGLPFGLDAFCFELAPKPRVIQVPDGYGEWQDFHAYTMEGTDACAILVTRELV